MADLQSTNRTKLSKSRETVYGVTDSNPLFKQVRQTSSGLNANPRTIQTEEIRSDRQVTDLILVGLSAGGPIGGELSFRSHDEDLEEALQGTWDQKPVIETLVADTEISDVSTTTITVASGGTAFVAGMLVRTTGFNTEANNRLSRVNSSTGTTIVFPAATFTAEAAIPVGATARVVGFAGAIADLVATITDGNALTSTLLDFTTLGLNAGEWIKIGSSVTDTGFATAANNGWARIAADGIAANRLDLDIVPASWAADAGTGKVIRVFAGDFLTNASTKRSNTFERQYLDHSPTSYEYFTGQILNTLSMSMEAQAIVTLAKTYIGAEAAIETSRISGSTDEAAPTTDVMNTTADFGSVLVDGSIVTGPNFIMTATFEINNNLRQQNAIGSLGAVGIGNGEFTVTGTLNTYFGSPEVYERVISNEESSFAVRVIDNNDAEKPCYVFDVPTIKFSAGAPSVTGKNADVMLDGTYQGIMHDELGFTMSIGRFWYTPA